MTPLLAFLFLSLGLYAQDLVEVPPLAKRVTDLTNTLKPAQRSQLESILHSYEVQKGSQVAVLLVPSTKPESIEDYSIRVAEKWKIGRRKVDDGLILIIAKDDRRLRIEVGYGLEGILTDTVTNKIINYIIKPHLKKGDFYMGIKKGLEGILTVIQGEELPEPTRVSSLKRYPRSKNSLYLLFLFLAVFLARILRGTLGAVTSSVIIMAISIFLGFLFINWVSGLIVGVLASAFSGVSGMAMGGTRYYGGGGFGGGFGGGGFSGGGGGFGGGGSSGSW